MRIYNRVNNHFLQIFCMVPGNKHVIRDQSFKKQEFCVASSAHLTCKGGKAILHTYTVQPSI